MPDEQELRQTSDGFLARIDRLHRLEERKREMRPDEMVAVAREVEALTRDILDLAERQTALAEAVAEDGEADVPAIAVVPPRAANGAYARLRKSPDPRRRAASRGIG